MSNDIATLDQWAIALAEEKLPLGLSLAVIQTIASDKHRFGFYLPLNHMNMRIASVASLLMLDGYSQMDGVELQLIKNEYMEREDAENE